MLQHLIASLLLAQSEAPKQAPGPLDGGLGTLLPFAAMALIVYFMMIRPASKQRKDHDTLLSALKKDDEVVTSGGMYGRIVSLEDKIATLEIADKVKIKILRDRIAGRWEPEKAAAKPS